MSNQSKERMNAEALPANGDALEGARRATEDASPFAPPNPEVAAAARRRQFSAAERTRILNAADACKAPGDIGALMRREGIYSSLLSTWRTQRNSAQRLALEPQKRGPKVNPMLAHTQGMAKLTRENDRLRRQLAQAHTIIDVQKKVSSLLELLTAEKPQGSS
jgi:transposase-like protein